MRSFSCVCILSLAPLINGCATLPEPPEDALEVAELVRNIKCELRNAAWMDVKNDWVREWNAALTVSLIIDHQGGITTDGTWTFPLPQGGNFILGVTAGATGSANRTERLSFNENLTKLNQDKKLRCVKSSDIYFSRLSGNLGFDKVFERARKAITVARVALNQLDYNIDFVIKKEGSLNPKWTLIPIGTDRKFSGGIKWSGSRTDTHTLKVVLQPPKEPCKVKDQYGNCASPVYNVWPSIASKPLPTSKTILPRSRSSYAPRSSPASSSDNVTGPPSGSRKNVTRSSRRSGASRRRLDGLTDNEARELKSGQTRNLLQSLDDQLRRDGIQ